ncbi:hypothetical protein DV515_00008484 [Chloebia gouldiae]|uniref:Uncharacterized protein n=1 Tax=Chloebia gouldiae TaxID=44316 RepID=A0A3L8SG72_CHLGU|nr:hypothetical protein DV515_00008484 [Chloebia gouldiae]
MGVLPVPAEVRAILLDIEGTTTPIAFVQVRAGGRRRRGGSGSIAAPIVTPPALASRGAPVASPFLP